jgi:anaerobic selenocysteine-containing dehydrogenase
MSTAPDEFTWGRSTIETACPLDCPDSCSLAVRVERGRIVEINGSTRQPLTGGYICAKVRRFGDRVYGEDRILRPGARKGPKGNGTFRPVTWDEALEQIADRIREIRARWGGEAILPFCYGGSNGLLSQDTTDADLFRRLGASRLARTVCAAPTGAAAQAAYGKMAGVGYADYVHARLIVVWGANPSTSGIHLLPFIHTAQRQGTRVVVVDPRRTPLAKRADLHLAVAPGSDIAVALALHRYLFEEGLADRDFLERWTSGAERLREKATPWTFERASEIARVPAEAIRQFADWYAGTSPAVIRCGWGLERNRNGGHAALAILALPAVAGKFGVRGGGYTMSNSAAWNVSAKAWIQTDEPQTRLINMNRLGRVLTEEETPPIKLLFVYNCNPVATMPDQNRVIKGLQRADLFTVVFDQVATDTTPFADIVLPATTFLESYDLVKGYGALSLQLAQPVIDAVGDSRSNVEVFSDLARRLGFRDDVETEAEALLRVLGHMPETSRQDVLDGRAAAPPCGPSPVQFVDVHPRTPDGKVHLFPEHLDEAAAPAGLYSYHPDPSTPQHPLTLISPASDKTISSTLGELGDRPARLQMHPDDAAARGLSNGDTVRVFNDLGEVHCHVGITDEIRPGIVSLPKGLWRRRSLNGSTANALAPDSVSDLGGGACFNDARVQVARVFALDWGGREVTIAVQ